MAQNLKTNRIDLSRKFSGVQTCFIGDPKIGSDGYNVDTLIENLDYACNQSNVLVFGLTSITRILDPEKLNQLEDKIEMGDFLKRKDLLFYAKSREYEPLLMKLLELFVCDKLAFLNSDSKKISRYFGGKIQQQDQEDYEPYFLTEIALKPHMYVPKIYTYRVVVSYNYNQENVGYKSLRGLVQEADMFICGHNNAFMLTINDENREIAGQNANVNVIHMSFPVQPNSSLNGRITMKDKPKNPLIWAVLSSTSYKNASIQRSMPGHSDYRFMSKLLTDEVVVPTCSFFTPRLQSVVNTESKGDICQIKRGFYIKGVDNSFHSMVDMLANLRKESAAISEEQGSDPDDDDDEQYLAEFDVQAWYQERLKEQRQMEENLKSMQNTTNSDSGWERDI